jgi:hypothetical protein
VGKREALSTPPAFITPEAAPQQFALLESYFECADIGPPAKRPDENAPGLSCNALSRADAVTGDRRHGDQVVAVTTDAARSFMHLGRSLV